MKKRFIIIPLAVLGTFIVGVSIPFIILGIRTSSLDSDYQYLKNDKTYNTKVEVNDLELVTQHISCGYATIEMMSSYYGNKVNEDELEKKNNGGISTSSSNGFLAEVNDSIKNKTFSKYSYLKNDELLKHIHDSLSKDNPVAIEWAAEYEGEWTLHFSLISGLDLSSDKVTIYNPYGYIETIGVNDFVDRASFNAYKNMPLFLNFGFAFGAFEKNTIFYAD